MLDAIIISDIHIGAHNCQGKLIVDFLEKIHTQEMATKRLVLNGDVFEQFDSRLCKWNWKILSALRSISDKVEVAWVKGNHDAYGPALSIAHLIGAEYYDEEYIFESADKRILCIHGDTFDDFLTEHPIMTWFADMVYWLLQKIDSSYYLAKLAKHSSKTFLRCAKTVEEEAMKYKEKRGCDLVCCGHTHFATVTPEYFNSGTWTELPSTYLEVKDGVIQLKTWSQNGQEGISQT